VLRIVQVFDHKARFLSQSIINAGEASLERLESRVVRVRVQNVLDVVPHVQHVYGFHSQASDEMGNLPQVDEKMVEFFVNGSPFHTVILP
jgi:hypothetical protein